MGSAHRVAVIGCGHVGTVTAACMAELGHSVIGVDVDPSLIARLKISDIPFVEPGLNELVAKHSARGQLSFTSDYGEALDGAEFIFLCVNTPATTTGAADLRYVRQAVAQIAEACMDFEYEPLIVNKSTSPVGMGETIEAIFRNTYPSGRSIPAIVANPEFLQEGRGVQDFLHPDRIVVGSHSRADAECVAILYAGISAPVIYTDIRSAEMIKYVSNAFLATKVSFVNEIAKLCEGLGVEVDSVLEGASFDPRIGNLFMKPGVGYGGSCLPKDVAALCHTGDSAGLTMRVLSAVQEVNILQRKHVVNGIRRALGRLEGATIGVWGVTFKAGSEDLRESPAIDVINLLRNEGALLKVYDPTLGVKQLDQVVDQVCTSPLEAAADVDCLAILTDWQEFSEISLRELRSVMKGNVIYDGRNQLQRSIAEAEGFEYHGIGRSARAVHAPLSGK